MEVDREGRFRVKPVSWNIRESVTSQSVGIELNFFCLEWWNQAEEKWINVTSKCFEVTGAFWVIGKTGEANERATDDLQRCLGWNGEWSSVSADSGWTPWDCQIDVTSETYKDKIRHKASWLHRMDSSPTGGKVTDKTKLAELDAKYGAKIKAVLVEAAAPPAPYVPAEESDDIPF